MYIKWIFLYFKFFMISICISNFILIDNHTFSLDAGLTSVTGETGAGKSIIFEAIRFLSGERAGASVIKKGKEFTEITATMSLLDFPQLSEFVTEFDLDIDDDEFFIRRKINKQGKGSVFINNAKITLSQLKLISEKLFVIVGQKDSQLLYKPDYQLNLIDLFGGLSKSIKKVKSAYLLVKSKQKELQVAKAEKAELESQKKLLEYQIEELNKLDPKELEYKDLEGEHHTLANATELTDALKSASNALASSKRGAIPAIHDAISELGKFGDVSDIANIIKILENSKIDLEEAANDSSSMANRIVFSPERFKVIDDKITTYYNMSKKLDTDPENLHITHQEMIKELECISSIDIDKIKTELNSAIADYYIEARLLSSKRISSANKLSAKVNGILLNLKMRKNSFSVDLIQSDVINSKGIDSATYMLKSNAESDNSPMATSASGGEMSRITLAINTIMSSTYDLKRFHFLDEIDTGVSGKTASYIGDLLKKMAADYPVVCITHIPHVAGMAQNQIHIEKIDTEKTTKTTLRKIDGQERVSVIAILLFGDDYSAEQFNEAKKLIG